MVRAATDELGIEAERDVVEEQPLAGPAHVDSHLPAGERVERRDRVTPVEPEVPGEVVPGPIWNADERQAPLDRDLRDRRERTVAAGDSQHVRIGIPRNLGGVLALLQGVRGDAATPGRRRELLGARPGVPGPRIYDQKARHSAMQPMGPLGREVEPFGPWRRPTCVSIVTPMSERGLHWIEDDLSDTWVEDWAGAGVAEIELYLAKYAAFLSFLDNSQES